MMQDASISIRTSDPRMFNPWNPEISESEDLAVLGSYGLHILGSWDLVASEFSGTRISGFKYPFFSN